MSEKLAKKLWKKCQDLVAEHGGEVDYNQDFGEFMRYVNKTLDPLGMVIRSRHEEWKGVVCFVLVNTKEDEEAKLATDMSVNDISYFRTIIEMIMTAPDLSYSVSALDAKQETPKGMTKSLAESLLSTLVARGWLLKSVRGRYSLGIRSHLELEHYLRTNYADEILECVICHEIVTRGNQCFTSDCSASLHYHCLGVYYSRQEICPKCKEPWPKLLQLAAVGQEAIEQGQDNRRSSRGGRRQSAAATSDVTDTEKHQEEEDSQEEAPVTQRRISKRGSASRANDKAKGKGKGKQRPRDQESDEEMNDGEDQLEDDGED